jgi:hypothetical protein
MEEVLGIKPTGAGFSTVDIRPDLADLAWARGAEPTPRGLLKVDAHRADSDRTAVTVDIPDGVTARVSVPATSRNAKLLLNGEPQAASYDEDGSCMVVTLKSAGHYELRAQ